MPTSTFRRASSIALGLALIGTLSACAAETSDGEADAQSTGSPESATSASEGATAPSEHLTQADSPLEQELGGVLAQIYGEREVDATAIKNEQQEFIAACMAKEGFDYVPIVYSAEGVAPEAGASLTELEWAAQYGYGYFTQPLIQADTEAMSGTEAAGEDTPNAEAVAAMSEAERYAWNMALYGFDEASGDEVPQTAPAEERGCNYQSDVAFREKRDPGKMTDIMADPRFAELIDASMSVGDAAAVVSAEAAADADWSGCMADSGYPDLEAPWAADELAMSPPWDPYADASEDGEISEPTPEQITTAQQSEIALAVADETCQAEVSYDDRFYEARFEAERQFLKDYQDEVEALKLAVAEASE